MNRTTLTAFVDVLMLLIVALFTMLAMAKSADKKAEEELSASAGQLSVQIVWPADRGSDVDLWVRAPGDQSVGYSAKSGRVFDLVRDDLGDVNDNSGLNFEIAFSRWTPAGEYIVNLFYYRDDGRGPVEVKVIGMLRREGNRQLFMEDVRLERKGQELTVIRFTLDTAGAVLGTNHIPVSLVRAK